MRDRTRISASNLGLLASDDACRLCFWLMLIVGSKFPYRFPFPGVMFALDRMEKAIVKAAIEHDGTGPDWLGDLAAAESILDDKKLRYEHESGMTLTGIPDVVFGMPDGSLGLVDFKTAAFRGPDGPLFDKYVVQLSVYALLLQEAHKKKVDTCGLVYFQAEGGAKDAGLLSQLTDSGITVNFSAHWLPVKIDQDRVNDLLDEAHELATTNEPPAAASGCQHCKNLESVNELISGILQPLVDANKIPWLTTSERIKIGCQMDFRKHRLQVALKNLLDALEDIRHCDPWSVIGQWDFTDDEASK